MTKIAISPNVNGTGTFTIAAPNSNTDRTLTLPDAGGEVLTNASDIAAANLTGNVAAARITTALSATGTAPIFAVRAWGNFDGINIGTRGSGNLSMTRLATGDFRFTMATAMPDADYCITVSCSAVVGAAAIAVARISTTVFDVAIRRSSTEAAGNPAEIFVQVVR